MEKGVLGCTISIIGAGLCSILFVVGTLTGSTPWATVGILGGGGIILVICGLVIMSKDTKKPTAASQPRSVTPPRPNYKVVAEEPDELEQQRRAQRDENIRSWVNTGHEIRKGVWGVLKKDFNEHFFKDK